MMHDRKKDKGEGLARAKLERQLKMAEIQKQKAEDLEKAREAAQQQVTAAPEEKVTGFNKMVEKTRLMEILIPKQAYSRPTYFKRHLINQQKINDFLGRNLVERETEDDQADIDAESFLTTPSEQLEKIIGKKDITYKVLLDALADAEGNYDHMR